MAPGILREQPYLHTNSHHRSVRLHAHLRRRHAQWSGSVRRASTQAVDQGVENAVAGTVDTLRRGILPSTRRKILIPTAGDVHASRDLVLDEHAVVSTRVARRKGDYILCLRSHFMYSFMITRCNRLRLIHSFLICGNTRCRNANADDVLLSPNTYRGQTPTADSLPVGALPVACS